MTDMINEDSSIPCSPLSMLSDPGHLSGERFAQSSIICATSEAMVEIHVAHASTNDEGASLLVLKASRGERLVCDWNNFCRPRF